MKAAIIPDEELLREVSVTASTELEHLNKIKSKSSSNQIFAVSTSSEVKVKENNDRKKKENLLLVEINKLNAKLSELSSMHEEIRELKQQVASGYNNEWESMSTV